MNPKNSVKWTKAVVETLKVRLDPENARIDADRSSSQDVVRGLLLQTEKIVELANSIVRSGALFAGERIIVIKEGNDITVLEGNRRVCACQILLNPWLAPSEYRKRLLAIGNELKTQISRLDADVAPNREAAEIIITRRHTQPGIEQWTPIAKQRRIARMIEAGSTVPEVMDRFQMDKAAVTRILRDHEVLKQVKDLGVWNADEEKKLHHPQLKTNPFTRFFTLKGAKQTLGISFDDKGHLTTTLDKPRFKKAIESVARELLLPEQIADEGRLNTRAKPEEVFQKAFKGKKDLEHLLKPAKKESKTNGKLSAKADKFFETLVCPIQDDQLIQVTKEISTINYSQYKTAATFLLRALLERTIDWCLKKYNLTGPMMREFHQKFPGSNKEPGLDFKIVFCINHRTEMFAGNVKGNLEHWRQTKHIADLVIHGKWAQASAPRLEEAASTIRPFIKNIFDGSALKS